MSLHINCRTESTRFESWDHSRTTSTRITPINSLTQNDGLTKKVEKSFRHNLVQARIVIIIQQCSIEESGRASTIHIYTMPIKSACVICFRWLEKS